jgi:hypothetical protein
VLLSIKILESYWRVSWKVLLEILSLTLNTPEGKPSLLWTLYTLWRDKEEPYMDSEHEHDLFISVIQNLYLYFLTFYIYFYIFIIYIFLTFKIFIIIFINNSNSYLVNIIYHHKYFNFFILHLFACVKFLISFIFYFFFIN